MPTITYRKTDRVYGATYKAILDRAAKGKFCVSELTPPFDPILIALNAYHLAQSGRLVCVKKAQIGRNRQRAVYRLP